MAQAQALPPLGPPLATTRQPRPRGRGRCRASGRYHPPGGVGLCGHAMPALWGFGCGTVAARTSAGAKHGGAQLRRWLVLPPTGGAARGYGGAEIPASALLGVPMVAQGAPGAPMPMSGLVPATLVGVVILGWRRGGHGTLSRRPCRRRWWSSTCWPALCTVAWPWWRLPGGDASGCGAGGGAGTRAVNALKQKPLRPAKSHH